VHNGKDETMTAPSLQPAAESFTAEAPAGSPVTWTAGWPLTLARIAWLGIALLSIALFVASLPYDYTALRQLHDAAIAHPRLLANGLDQLGIPVAAFAAYVLTLKVIFAAVWVGTAALLFRRRSDEPIVLLVSFTLLALGVASELTHPAFTAGDAVLQGPTNALSGAAFITFFLLAYLFPDGRFVPRWTVWPAAVWVAAMGLANIAPDSPLSPPHWPAVFGAPLLFGVPASMIYAQVYRYRRVSGPLQRQQTKWIAFGFAVAVAGYLIGMLPNVFAGFLPPAPAEAVNDIATYLLAAGAFLLMPAAVAVAVLRYHLWDIDVIISRAILYSALSITLIGLYVLVAGGIGALLPGRFDPVLSFAAAGLIAVLFAPLRARLQRGINRLLFGERDEPYAVLARLGRRLESTLAPEAVLPAIVQTVAEALKLPYAAITLREGPAVEAGTPVANPAEFPLIYQQDVVGRLLVAPRAGEERFSPSDHRLLDDLARQAGVAVHALQLHERTLQLAADLQRSRERLVTAREEERRRLRRDLHDGIGPTLASLTHRLDLAADLMRGEPEAAVAMLAELKAQVRTTVGDIRRLVYALRPPALDDFGLIPAIREHIAQQIQATGLQVAIEAPDPMPPLPAAVEVAVYRIVLEAVTNVVRHAAARTGRITLTVNGSLRLTVEDDGRGLPPNCVPGVGLASMRERAVELGGSCAIECRPTGGTIVRVRLPLTWQ
jgi:signal transduction histidine kinase